MSPDTKITLVDGNAARRQEMRRSLNALGCHVEPLESLSELEIKWPACNAILLQDEPGAIKELIELMVERGQPVPIVAFSESSDTQRIVDAIQAGAANYIAWPESGDEQARVLCDTLNRIELTCPSKIREWSARHKIAKLRPRELDALVGVSQGLSNQEIGEQLGISHRTVEIHRANMLLRLDASNTAEAIRTAVEAKVLDGLDRPHARLASARVNASENLVVYRSR